MSESTTASAAPRTYAHVINGVVVEVLVTDHDVTKLFPSTMLWVDVTELVPMPGRLWTYAAGSFTAPVAIPGAAPKLTSLEFMSLLTSDEQHAVATAGLASAPVMLWLLKLAGAMYVDLADPSTIGGVQALVAAGLLTADRATAILANQVPVAVTATAVGVTNPHTDLNASYTPAPAASPATAAAS